MTSDPIHIRVRGVTKQFSDQSVLKGVDLDCERGRINVIIGGSGAGKTVLLKHLIGLIKPDSGEIVVDGVELGSLDQFELNSFRIKFGMLFQYAALFDSMTVEENVMFPLLEHRKGKMSRAEMRSLVQEKLAALGLFNIEHKYPAQLSGGMRKRVGLARATILAPEILFYDEPTTGLDPIATQNVDQMIAETSANLGITSVVISHDMASAFRIGDRVSMLHEGRIVASGSPKELLSNPPAPLREFIKAAKVDLSEIVS